jgi:hypothetical protein
MRGCGGMRGGGGDETSIINFISINLFFIFSENIHKSIHIF